jgi:hypothetical protein
VKEETLEGNGTGTAVEEILHGPDPETFAIRVVFF